MKTLLAYILLENLLVFALSDYLTLITNKGRYLQWGTPPKDNNIIKEMAKKGQIIKSFLITRNGNTFTEIKPQFVSFIAKPIPKPILKPINPEEELPQLPRISIIRNALQIYIS